MIHLNLDLDRIDKSQNMKTIFHIIFFFALKSSIGTMKNFKNIICLTTCCLLLITNVFAQSTDEQLAFQYLQSKEYDKAIVYYEKFFNKRDGFSYYNPYVLCLTKLQQFDKAEKVIKKTIKQYPRNLTYLV